MPANGVKPAATNQFEHRQSYLSLRWLLIILGSYLTVFPRLGDNSFYIVVAFVLIVAATNVACSLTSPRFFTTRRVQIAIDIIDTVFVAVTFFLLRGPETYLFLAFTGVFLLAMLWRDINVLIFSLLVVSILYGVFSVFRAFPSAMGSSPTLIAMADSMGTVEQFLALSLFFIVAVFYLYLSDRLKRDARLSVVTAEEKHRAEVLAEITRSLSSLLNTEAILYLIATRLCEVTGAAECSIMRMDARAKNTEITVKAGDPKSQDLQDVIFARDGEGDRVRQSVIALPMLVNDAMFGMINLKFHGPRQALSDSELHFLKIMAGTAANAVRNAQMFEDTEHRARTDFLTGLPNHRTFQLQLSRELGRAQRHNHTLSLLMIDLDFLKRVNDQFGHPTGDAVIRAAAESIQTTCRDFDLPARYGGEEFAVILPETPLGGAIQAAERLRRRIAALEISGVGKVTASIGIANYPANALNKEDLVRVADQALYQAKNQGRDRVAHFEQQQVATNQM